MSKAVEQLGKQRQHLKALRLAATKAIVDSPEWQAIRDSRYHVSRRFSGKHENHGNTPKQAKEARRGN